MHRNLLQSLKKKKRHALYTGEITHCLGFNKLQQEQGHLQFYYTILLLCIFEIFCLKSTPPEEMWSRGNKISKKLTATATRFLLLFSILLYIFGNFCNKMLKMYIHFNLHIPRPHSSIYDRWGLLRASNIYLFLKIHK